MKFFPLHTNRIALFFAFLFIATSHSAFSQKLEWAEVTPEPTNYFGFSFATDGDDNIYAGPDYNGYGNFIYKYDKTGTLLWTFNYEAFINDEILFKFILADDGSIYSISNHVLLKISPLGKLVWIKNGADTSFFEDIAAGRNNTILVTVSQPGLIEKLDSSGAGVWIHALDSNVGGVKVALNGSNNVISTTSYYSNSGIGYGLIMLNDSGNKNWGISDSLSRLDFDGGFTEIQQDSDDNIYLMADFYGYNNPDFEFVNKYNSNGELLINKPDFGIYAPSAIGKNGLIYDPGDSGQIYIFDSSLNYHERFIYSSGYHSQFFNVALTSNKIYACGILDDNSIYTSTLLTCFDLNGNALWAQSYLTTHLNGFYAENIMVDHEGNILVSGLANADNNRIILKYADTSQIMSGISATNKFINQFELYPNPF